MFFWMINRSNEAIRNEVRSRVPCARSISYGGGVWDCLPSHAHARMCDALHVDFGIAIRVTHKRTCETDLAPSLVSVVDFTRARARVHSHTRLILARAGSQTRARTHSRTHTRSNRATRLSPCHIVSNSLSLSLSF